MKRKNFLLCLAAGALSFTAAQAQNMNDAVALLRSDVAKEKQQILTKAMNLSEAESTKFWPLQRAYQADLEKIGDRRIALMKDYATNWEAMSDEKAKQITTDVLKTDADRIKLKQKYFKEISKAVSPKAATRFLQVESQLERLIDIQTASFLPLAK